MASSVAAEPLIRPLTQSMRSGSFLPSVQATPLHAVSSSTPVPHWLVLMVAVLSLWVVIAGGVWLLDGLFERDA